MSLQHYKDFTIKAKLTDADGTHHRLLQLGATCVGEDRQRDHYFEVEHGKLKWRQGTIENVIMHYERKVEDGMERTTVHRYEVNPSSEAIADLKREHRALEVVEKRRVIYFIGHLKIHLDEWNNQFFLEIEAIDKHDHFSAEQLKADVMALFDKLGLAESSIVKTGYLQ